ncbi:MAG: DNA polymerase I [Acidimicrobiales bacterium]|nr:DNA polymerase I [Acidimicrobiales bacterium]
METVLLIDGNSLVYRAFFALREADMRTSSGQPTGAIHGFSSMLINLVKEHKPEEIAVAFDLPAPTFRHIKIPTYKAGREKAPDELYQQLGLVKEILTSLGILVVEKEGYEADDILATLATGARDRSKRAIVVTGDRDSYQLVEDPYIQVLYNKRGVSDYALYDENGIQERTGVSPRDYVLYAALRGDKSDNLPGVPGVGEKTAAKLVNSYSTLDRIFDSAKEQKPKLRENLENHEALVRSNVEVMELVRDVPIGIAPKDLVRGAVDQNEIKQVFEFLELHTVYGRLAEAFNVDVDVNMSVTVLATPEIRESSSPSEIIETLTRLREQGEPIPIAGSWSEGKDHSQLNGLCIASALEDRKVISITSEMFQNAEVKAGLQDMFDNGPGVIAHGSKKTIREMLRHGIQLTNLTLDTQIAAYLINPAEATYSVRDLATQYADTIFSVSEEVTEGQLDLSGSDPSPWQIAAEEAVLSGLLRTHLTEALEEHGLIELNRDVEIPLIIVLAKMEHLGIGVDVPRLTELRDELVAQTQRLRKIIHDQAGEEFNVNSPKQLQAILFENLGLTPLKKTKTGYSTDAQTLEKMRGDHPIIDHLMEYREVEKLRSTYGEGLLNEIGEGDRIRATFNQTVARTGRLSSDAPNLHNIPVRTERGKVFREVFIPRKGSEFLVADYNQIELRCIAHLAEDPGLIGAFTAGEDIHAATAAQIFGVKSEEVSTGQRSKAKMVSYGLAYGMEAYGLAQRLGITNKEAAEILESYFSAFPSVQNYMEETIELARERGYTETLFGRRRRIPELLSTNFRIRQAAERQAMNAGIQGLAADIFKVALINLDQELDEKGLKSRIVLQVHDEVILECPEEEIAEAEMLTVQTMATAYELVVPLEVHVSSGQSWAEAK